MRKRHATCGDHHQDAEYTLNGIKMLVLVGLFVGLDTPDEKCANHCNT
jgi:hypothetical protein